MDTKKIALIDDNESITFKELEQLVLKKQLSLKFDKGQFIALTAENNINFVATLLAAKNIKPLAILSKNWTESEKQIRLNTIKDTNIHPLTKLILFTSGSCGHPKAVLLSEKNIKANTEAVIESLLFHDVELQHLHLPLSYSFGLLGQLIPALELGITTYLHREIMDLAYVFHGTENIGMLSAVPEQWAFLCQLARGKDIARSVTHVVSAGSRLTLSLRKELRECFPNAVLFNNYGMTECSPRILSMNSYDPEFFSEAVGRPVKGIQLSFTDDEVLRIQGPQVMLGYANDDEVQNSTLLSGDIGFMEKGLVYLKGRRDDLVKISGERISCQDLTNCIREVDNIDEVRVLAYDDDEYGKRLAAFLVLKDKSRKEDFVKVLKSKLSGNRRPAKIKFLDQIPLNASGKTDRRALLKMIGAQ